MWGVSLFNTEPSPVLIQVLSGYNCNWEVPASYLSLRDVIRHPSSSQLTLAIYSFVLSWSVGKEFSRVGIKITDNGLYYHFSIGVEYG